MATMNDIAKRANVAVSTVSYALNGTRPISAETRARIEAAMEELGYRPHALARGLASKRSRIIALLFPPRACGLGTTDFQIVTGAADAAREHGYHLLLSPLPTHDREATEQLTMQGLIDGAVVMEMRDAGLQPAVRMCEDSPGAGYRTFEELLAAHPDLTGLVAMNEGATVGSMHAITGQGRRVPDDFAIVAIASSQRAAEMTMPALTTMEVPSTELGRLGVEALVAQFEDQQAPRLQRVLPCRLVVRGSSGPIGSSAGR